MNLLTLEDEKFKTITANGQSFRIRFMTPMDRIRIAQHRMKLQGGNPVDALTQDDFLMFENIAIVDTCVEDLPKGYNENETCAKWPDIEIIHAVAHEIRKHTIDVEAKLKKNKPAEGSE